MHGEYIALIGLAGSLLATLVVSTWRFSSLATKMTTTIQTIEEKEKVQDARLSALDAIPLMKSELGHVKENHAQIPKLAERVRVLEEQVKHSKEMRKVLMRQSRPDAEE